MRKKRKDWNLKNPHLLGGGFSCPSLTIKLGIFKIFDWEPPTQWGCSRNLIARFCRYVIPPRAKYVVLLDHAQGTENYRSQQLIWIGDRSANISGTQFPHQFFGICWVDWRTLYCRTPEKWFADDIQQNDSAFSRKIGGTGRKSETQAKNRRYSWIKPPNV